MLENEKLIRVIAVVFCLAAPALSVRVLSELYGLQHLLPLGLIEQNLTAARKNRYGETSARIDVTVGWGRDWTGATTREKLRDVLTRTLNAQTKMYDIAFEDVPGDRIGVSFAVGPNIYGPFPPSQMARGLQTALVALRMSNGL